MNINRRKFISNLAMVGGAASFPLLSSCSQFSKHSVDTSNYSVLDEALRLPVLKREFFNSPVIIETLELLRDRNSFICRVRSKDGAEGISIGNPIHSKHSYPMFHTSLYNHFIRKDARDLDLLVFNAAERNVKRQGVPLCIQLATIEFAILDMLGNIANKPVGQLIGDIHNPEIAIYLGTQIGPLRRMEPEKSLALMEQDVLESNAKAIKLRAGRGDYLASDIDNAPGRTEKLIRLARKKFGDDMILMIDGNGSYSVKEAIRIGKLLEEYNYYFYEEPVPWDWYEEQKQVAEALKIPMAGGEAEFGMHAFRWLIGNNAFEILQPDTFYFGGMIRSMQVARMAAIFGKTIAPHMTNDGLGYIYMLQLASVLPNAAEYHEFKMFQTKDANGTIIPIESKTVPFSSKNGKIKVPTGSGLGIVIDPEYIKTHKLLPS